MKTLALASLCLAHAALGAMIVIPNMDAAQEGNDKNNSSPFRISTTGMTSYRYQQVYDADGFISLGGPILITGIDFRPNVGCPAGSAGNPGCFPGSAFSATIPSIRIDLSTTSKLPFCDSTGCHSSPNRLSLTFANNVGADDLTVFPTGSLSFSSAFTGPDGGPKAFDIHVGFANPFLYDPSKGNLLLDARTFISAGITLPLFDSESNTCCVSRVANSQTGGANGTVGDFADGLGLVTQFEFTSVPEPSTGVLAAAGLIAALILRRRLVARYLIHNVD